MKTKICLFVFLLFGYYVADSKDVAENNQSSASHINVTVSPDLYNLADKWVREYENQK